MKKTLIILLASILCILFATFGVSASSNVDNEKYIPKVITTDNGYKMIFDAELARIARRMSSDAYDVWENTDVTNDETLAQTFREEEFKDIKQSHTSDVIMEIITNNFLVGVKTFEIDGREKHVLAIAFRGTQMEVSDWLTDGFFVDVHGFHMGFYAAAWQAFETLSKMEFESIKNADGENMTFSEYLAYSGVVGSDYSILVTGHSLGGAVANVFTGAILSQYAKNNVMCYTFAAPLVCSPDKAKEYDAYNIFNIINTNDIVPKVGYEIFKGVRLGNDLMVTVSDSEDSAHRLSTTYEKATNQVISRISSLFPYIYRIHYTTTENGEEITSDEIYIKANCSLDSRRFPNCLTVSKFAIDGNVTINQDVMIKGDLSLNGTLDVNANITISGDFYNNGILKMVNDDDYVLVTGDYTQSGTSEYIKAGTIEIKGDMYCNGYKPSGTHKTLLSGEKEQQINIDSHNINCGFNILEITNISNEGVVFIGKNFVKGELYSNSSTKIINGTNLRMIKNATIRGIWNSDLGATNWICDNECHINGNLLIQNIYENDSTNFNANVKVNGDLEVSSYANILKVNKGIIEIGGNLINSGRLLMTNDDTNAETNIARIIISGDFKTSFGAVQMSNDNAYILINGNCSGFNVASTSLSAGTIELKGNMTENCHYYVASGTHKTILSGENEQQINLNSYSRVGNFNILEIANTSEEGVIFLNYVGVSLDIVQPIGTEIIGGDKVGLQNKFAFVDYGKLNDEINRFNENAENVIPTWLDYERYCKFALDGDKAFTLNETITNTSFNCDLYFSDDYIKKTALVIIAFYDEEDKFVQMASKSVDVKAGKIDVSINYESKAYSKYKIMVWESLDNLKPLMVVQ